MSTDVRRWTGEPIEAPGIYSIPEEAYHSACTAQPSLSSSGARQIIDECPALYWHSSYLNPDRAPEESTPASDFGTATHVAILEPERWAERVTTVQKDDWRTNEAKAAREKARAEGKIALLAKDAERVSAISIAVARHPLASKAFTDGETERSLIWRDGSTDVWCKTRPDYLVRSRKQIIQLKTVPCAHPRAFERHAYDMGYYQRAAWEIEGVFEVLGYSAEAIDYFFIAQERDPPYLVSVCKLADRAIEFGFLQNAKAREIFAECLSTGRWPGYGDRAEVIGLPSYAEFQLEQRRADGEFEIKKRPTRRQIETAIGAQAPL